MNVCWFPRSRLARPVFLWAITAQLMDLIIDALPSVGFTPPPLMRLLPVLPALLFILASVRAVQKMDELEKRICLESVFIAFMLTLLVVFTFSSLEHARVYQPAWDRLGIRMIFFWACAYVLSSWRYR
jgi:hypothetical protein